MHRKGLQLWLLAAVMLMSKPSSAFRAAFGTTLRTHVGLMKVQKGSPRIGTAIDAHSLNLARNINVFPAQRSPVPIPRRHRGCCALSMSSTAGVCPFQEHRALCPPLDESPGCLFLSPDMTVSVCLHRCCCLRARLPSSIRA